MTVFIFRERAREGETGRETSIGCLSHSSGPCNTIICLDWESNWQTFGLQEDAQPTEPHQSGHIYTVFLALCLVKIIFTRRLSETSSQLPHSPESFLEVLIPD